MNSDEWQYMREKYENRQIKADAYFLKSSGMLANQTQLKMGEYYLSGTPATLSFHSLSVLFVLTQEESAYFSRFVKSLHLLTLVFQDVNRKDPIRIPLWVVLDRIDIVRTHANLSLMNLIIKNESTDYIGILGKYIALLDYKRESWEKLADTFIPMDPNVAAAIDFNDYLELLGDEKPRRVRISGFSATKAFLKSVPPQVKPEAITQLKWYFRDGLVLTDGKLDLSDPERPTFVMDFHPRIVDAIEAYQLKMSFLNRKKS